MAMTSLPSTLIGTRQLEAINRMEPCPRDKLLMIAMNAALKLMWFKHSRMHRDTIWNGSLILRDSDNSASGKASPTRIKKVGIQAGYSHLAPVSIGYRSPGPRVRPIPKIETIEKRRKERLHSERGKGHRRMQSR
ncbi:hypothetical protein ACE6H2_013721 [Prunus campanulata]